MFISLEGIEGSGKSSHVHTIQAFLEAHGLKSAATREPGGTAIAEQIRKLLLRDSEEELTPEAEALLFYAARAQHIAHFIKPQLERGVSVICDRFVDSGYAYQQGGRAVPLARLDQLTDWIVQDCLPDLTFVFDLPAEQALARINDRPLDRIEQEHLSFHQQVRQAYLDRARQQPERYAIINAAQTKKSVKADIVFCLEAYFETDGFLPVKR